MRVVRYFSQYKLLFVLSILIVSIISCDFDMFTDIINIEVTNSSDENIEMVYLSTAFNEAKTADSRIDKSKTADIEFSFRNVTKSDGAYRIHYRFVNSPDTIRKDVGYYTNGIPLDDIFFITIYRDSLNISINQREFGLY